MIRPSDRHLVARRIRSRDGFLPQDRRGRDDNRRRARRTDPKGSFAPEAAGRGAVAGGQSHRHRGIERVGGAQRPAGQAPASCFHATALEGTQTLAGGRSEDTARHGHLNTEVVRLSRLWRYAHGTSLLAMVMVYCVGAVFCLLPTELDVPAAPTTTHSMTHSPRPDQRANQEYLAV